MNTTKERPIIFTPDLAQKVHDGRFWEWLPEGLFAFSATIPLAVDKEAP